MRLGNLFLFPLPHLWLIFFFLILVFLAAAEHTNLHTAEHQFSYLDVNFFILF